MTSSLPPARSGNAFPGFCLLALALAVSGVLPAFGNTITVTNTNDSGAGSLREVIATAASGDTINFNVPYPATITLSSTLSICNSQTLTIGGPGASKLAISGNKVQVFNICNGANVTLSGLTIEKGFASIGGGLYNSGTLTVTNSTLSGNSAGAGGGIYNAGALTVTNSTFSGNSAVGPCPVDAGYGGGITNAGTAAVTNSTLSGNSAGCGGGGIENTYGTLTLTNSTLSGNSAGYYGGGIDNNSGTLAAVSSTIAGNSAANGGGIDSDFGIAATLKSTLLASNAGGNCASNPLTSAGYNLSDDATCAGSFTQPTDKNNTPAGLDPKGLQNNGGATQTIALLPTSPAVDAIPVASCTDTNGTPVKTDQRGVTRPQGAGCDIGAYELVQAVPFSDFDASLAIQTGQHSGFALGAWFTLGTASDGIHPLTEAVTLQIANYTVTIPAGSFHRLWNSSQAPYAYEGTINGTKLVVGIIPLGGKNYQFDAAGSPVVWNGVKNPVTVSLTIGNDTGSTPVNAVISSR